jgi:ornithine carbamoyltransferase
MHLLNFKELPNQELTQIVDTAIAIKNYPQKYATAK